MSVSTEYAKQVKTPIIRAKVTRFFSGTPGVSSSGTPYYPEVISCNINAGFNQGSASCTLVIATPYDINGNEVRFEPMDRVEIRMGWNTFSASAIRFFGFVDVATHENPPRIQTLECRDILKLAQDNYYIWSNRKVYYTEEVPDELDENGDPMGGQSASDRTASAIITDFLTESGIPSSRIDLDSDLDDVYIGNNAVAVFVYESALDAINRICDLLGYKVWSDASGYVRVRMLRPIASESASVTYQSQEEVFQGSEAWAVTQEGNAIRLSMEKSDDLRNWITVKGYGDIESTVAGESDYVSSPPTYRRAEIRSYLLDTQAMVTSVAQRVYEDLNRLRYTGRVTIEGDPRVQIGTTIAIYDAYATNEIVNFFLYDYTSRFESGRWMMDLNLVGGVGTGSTPLGNISPVACFTYQVNQEWTEAGALYDVFVDGRCSYDPDGTYDGLNFTWVCSGYDNVHTDTHTYAVSELTGYIDVTLIVTDSADPPLSNSISKTIYLTEGETTVYNVVYVVDQDGKVNYTDDGGLNWDSTETINAVCVAADHKAKVALIGCSDGSVYKCLWSGIDLVSGEYVDSVAVFTKVYEASAGVTSTYIDYTRNFQDYPSGAVAYFGLNNGELWKTEDSMNGWTKMKDFGGASIVRIRGNEFDSNQLAVGEGWQIHTTSDGGVSWRSAYYGTAELDDFFVRGNEIQALFGGELVRSLDFGTIWYVSNTGEPVGAEAVAFDSSIVDKSIIVGNGILATASGDNSTTMSFVPGASFGGQAVAIDEDRESEMFLFGTTTSGVYKTLDFGYNVHLFKSIATKDLALGGQYVVPAVETAIPKPTLIDTYIDDARDWWTWINQQKMGVRLPSGEVYVPGETHWIEDDSRQVFERDWSYVTADVYYSPDSGATWSKKTTTWSVMMDNYLPTDNTCWLVGNKHNEVWIAFCVRGRWGVSGAGDFKIIVQKMVNGAFVDYPSAIYTSPYHDGSDFGARIFMEATSAANYSMRFYFTEYAGWDFPETSSQACHIKSIDPLSGGTATIISATEGTYDGVTPHCRLFLNYDYSGSLWMAYDSRYYDDGLYTRYLFNGEPTTDIGNWISSAGEDIRWCGSRDGGLWMCQSRNQYNGSPVVWRFDGTTHSDPYYIPLHDPPEDWDQGASTRISESWNKDVWVHIAYTSLAGEGGGVLWYRRDYNTGEWSLFKEKVTGAYSQVQPISWLYYPISMNNVHSCIPEDGFIALYRDGYDAYYIQDPP